MIARVIELSVKNRVLVILAVCAVSLWGVYCLYRTPVDAIPDLSENQVIVWADWNGRNPKDVEDQITYPLSVNLEGLAGVKSIRASSELGFSMITIIFDDDVDFYFARQRVLEKLSTAATLLPEGVTAHLAADATALGQVFWYTVEGEGKSLDELRAIQDWYVRYQLYVPGVAEVASVGGFVREYQIDVDPVKLRALDVSLGQVFDVVMRSNASVGGKVLHKGGSEYLISAVGWVRGLDDLRDIVVTERRGVPVTLEQLGAVQLGPAFRRGLLEKNGHEAVGGVVMMRYGQNPLEVIRRVKAKIISLQAGLPPGVRVVPFYDRTGLIAASIGTLTKTLIEEIAIASLVVFLVLWHFRSAFVICITLPLAVLVSFIFMYYLKIPSNIMSLSGIAISIGVLVDAGIVMTENAYNRLQQHFAGRPVTGDTRDLVIDACKVVGGPLFFSIVIMLLSFAPVFVLGGLESKLFTPLACTKSFALVGVAVLAVTLVPALIPTFVRGRLRSQNEVWLVRSFVNIYKPLLEFFLKHPDVIVVITGLFLIAGLPVFPRKMPWILFVIGAPFILGFTTMLVARRKAACFAILFIGAYASFKLISPHGEEFMPPLDELSLVDMPITRPNVNITQGSGDIKKRDAVLRQFPEVHQVVGKLGRAETPTDPAPLDMAETMVTLRSKDCWPKRKIDFQDAREEAKAVAAALTEHGLLSPMEETEREDFLIAVAMESLARFDRVLRTFCVERLEEGAPVRARELVRSLRRSVVSFLRGKGALTEEVPEARWEALEDALSSEHAERFNEWILLEDVTKAMRGVADFLVGAGAMKVGPELWSKAQTRLSWAADTARTVAGREAMTVFEDVHVALVNDQHALVAACVKQLNWEIEDRAPGTLVWSAIEGAIAKARADKRLAREPDAGELLKLRQEREKILGSRLFLRQKLKSDLVNEMDSDLQVPGWSNIWTQPIINRVDMLSTGVRTAVGVKVFGNDLDELQALSSEIAAVVRTIPGAVDVSADQIVGENYLEISIDRKKVALYGLTLVDVEDVIEVALGGKEITTTVEGRKRFAIRVRYGRDFLEDEEMVKNILVAARAYEMPEDRFADAAGMSHRMLGTPGDPHLTGGSLGGQHAGPGKLPGTSSPPAKGAAVEGGVEGASTSHDADLASNVEEPRLLQVPLYRVADVHIVTGPTMIKSENSLVRTFVSLNVRDRDIVGFVEEARRVVEAQVKLPPGCYTEWSGEFEHQVRAQKTLTLVLPLVVCIIFVVLYLTYRDFADTLLMFLAVPGAVAGGAIFQHLLPKLGVDVTGNFSVAVWVGYIACFGLATETSIVMLVYLREAIGKRGGIEKIQSEDEVKEAVIEGAVNRLRPKLLTEMTTILALIPMLWATGVGAEYMRPMAAPILGGILVADEVIDVLIPVLFYWDRCRRLRRRLEGSGYAAPGDQDRAREA